jgi:hypothetical protein
LPLPVLNPFLITASALALGRAGTLGIALAFRVTTLFGPLLASGAVLLALSSPLTLAVWLLRLGLAIPFNPARRTFGAATGPVNARTSIGLRRARRIHLALGARTSGAWRAHAAGLPTTWRAGSWTLSTPWTLCRKRCGVGSEHAARYRRNENSSHDCDSSLG